MPHRFATLVVALAVAAPAAAQDLFPDFSGETTVDAESFQSVGDLEFSARGRVEARRGDSALYAEQLRFNREFLRTLIERLTWTSSVLAQFRR